MCSLVECVLRDLRRYVYDIWMDMKKERQMASGYQFNQLKFKISSTLFCRLYHVNRCQIWCSVSMVVCTRKVQSIQQQNIIRFLCKYETKFVFLHTCQSDECIKRAIVTERIISANEMWLTTHQSTLDGIAFKLKGKEIFRRIFSFFPILARKLIQCNFKWTWHMTVSQHSVSTFLFNNSIILFQWICSSFLFRKETKPFSTFQLWAT